jgi:hypothetical protein
MSRMTPAEALHRVGRKSFWKNDHSEAPVSFLLTSGLLKCAIEGRAALHHGPPESTVPGSHVTTPSSWRTDTIIESWISMSLA